MRGLPLLLAAVLACGPGASAPRSAFPSDEEGRSAYARACLPDGSMSLLLLPDLAFISGPAPKRWYDSTPTDTSDLRFGADGGATEHRSKDANDPRVSAVFTLRAERWEVEGRLGDARFRPAVECVYRRLAER